MPGKLNCAEVYETASAGTSAREAGDGCRADLKIPCIRICRQIFQVWDAQEKFKQAAAENGLRFPVCGGLCQGCSGRSLAIESAENLLHHGALARTDRVPAVLRPERNAAFALNLKHLHVSDGDLRETRQFLFLRAHAENRFRKQRFLSRTVIDEEHAIPSGRFRIR